MSIVFLNPLLWLHPPAGEFMVESILDELVRRSPRARGRRLTAEQGRNLLVAHASCVAISCVSSYASDGVVVSSSVDAGVVGPSYPGRAETDRVAVRTRIRRGVVVGCSVVVERAKARRRDLPRHQALFEHEVEQLGPDWSRGFRTEDGARLMLELGRGEVNDVDGTLGRVVQGMEADGTRSFLVELDEIDGGKLWFGVGRRPAGRDPSDAEAP